MLATMRLQNWSKLYLVVCTVTTLRYWHVVMDQWDNPWDWNDTNGLRMDEEIDTRYRDGGGGGGLVGVSRNGGIRRSSQEIHPMTRTDRQDHVHYYYDPSQHRRLMDKPRVAFLTGQESTLTASPPMLPTMTTTLTATSSDDDDDTDNNDNTTETTHNNDKSSRHRIRPMSKNPTSDQDANHHIMTHEKPFYDTCTPMRTWQQKFHPVCNVVHDLEMDSLLSVKGSWRMAWKVQDAVLKMLNLDREFDQESFAYHHADSMAMDQLTSSRFVIQEYAFCGQTVVTEWAEGDGRSLVKSKSLSKRDRLKMARDLALGLNDIHSMDYGKGTNATFVHNDINMANLVQVAGQNIKFNDFNIGVLLRWNKTAPCGFPVRFEGNLWRSPEELLNVTYVSEKIDIYALGNVFYQILTTHQPWTWLEPEGKLSLIEVKKRKLQGGLPFIPDKYANNRDIYMATLYEAMLACYRHDPKERPTAYQLAKGMTKVLKWVGMQTDMTKEISSLKDLFQVHQI